MSIRDHKPPPAGGSPDEIARLHRKLSAAVRAICPPWLWARREDIAQVATMAVLRQLERDEDKRQYPASYLKKAAFTAMVDEIRRLRSRPEVPLEDTDEAPEMVSEHADPERDQLGREISTGVRECLDQLPGPRSSAVTLHLLGYKVPEIAQRMGWNRKQTQNLVFRGTQDLRRCLEARGLKP